MCGSRLLQSAQIAARELDVLFLQQQPMFILSVGLQEGWMRQICYYAKLCPERELRLWVLLAVTQTYLTCAFYGAVALCMRLRGQQLPVTRSLHRRTYVEGRRNQ